MEYRKMEKLGISPSVLGFGCMRFPLLEDGKIDEAEAERMLDQAMASGVTYFDTAYPYHNGDSEPFVGRVLKKYNREDFYLATKLPIWELKTKEDVKRIFDAQLERLQVDYVDFYLLHALDADKWKKVKELGILEFAEEMRAEGKIKYIGFSFHDEYPVFEEILTYRKWDFCQLQLNYIDTDIQAGMKGYELTVKENVPLVIMEPIKGGSLAVLPDDVSAMFKAHSPEASVSSWALRWIASLPNVKVVLSGMSTYEQVMDNLATYGDFKPLDEEEQKIVEKVAATIKSRTKNGCTGCAYCMPCPFGVDIPKNFRIWNDYSMYGDEAAAKRRFYEEMEDKERADKCQKCGACEKMCPQNLPIREHLERVMADMPAK